MRVGIYSLGCKVNIYESEYVERLLKNNGFTIVSFDSEADIYIINTCSVTNEADRKSRQIISRARKNNSNAVIVVMGCYSQVKSNDINADIVIGNKDKSKIVDLINEYVDKKNKIKRVYNLRDINEFESMEIDSFDNHTRAFVKIQDGCNAFCSYCIIPYTRGPIRSKKPDDVIREVTNLVNNGYKEIILTGIHTGKYGLDLDNYSLYDLLKEIIKIDGIYRVRLSSIEINELNDDILNLVKSSSIIARHFHIPLQSGSDKILKLMNRKYDLDYFLDRINKIRSIDKDISITTDLIVGFPSEDDNDFNDTINFLNRIKFTKIHTFPYSKRDNTKASVMPNQVNGDIKKKRVKKVIELSNYYENIFYNKYIGSVLDGVSEIRDDGSSVVHTSNFIPVIIKDNIDNNDIVKVRILDVTSDNKVYGSLVKE
ncbi:MAG: tRNA (N(6)-L-threonylcarbamoyladenosine(37)-C(2))-methylthiotransferase MtaB [Bacilli bacterium]|nr:tRNA (N(6)-L-threonylcarbamoyladenosine(37)-C(2))-methylthiotransferase MtaB [Bacilli bacterium]